MAVEITIEYSANTQAELNRQINQIILWMQSNIKHKEKLLGIKLMSYGATFLDSKNKSIHRLVFVNDSDAMLFRLANDFSGTWTTQELRVETRLSRTNAT